MIIIYLGIAYIVGAFLTYCLDGFLDWADTADDLFFSSLLWPIFIWFILGDAFRHAVKNARRRREERKEEERRLRIVAQKEMKQYEEELEEYIATKKRPVE